MATTSITITCVHGNNLSPWQQALAVAISCIHGNNRSAIVFRKQLVSMKTESVATACCWQQCADSKNCHVVLHEIFATRFSGKNPSHWCRPSNANGSERWSSAGAASCAPRLFWCSAWACSQGTGVRLGYAWAQLRAERCGCVWSGSHQRAQLCVECFSPEGAAVCGVLLTRGRSCVWSVAHQRAQLCVECCSPEGAAGERAPAHLGRPEQLQRVRLLLPVLQRKALCVCGGVCVCGCV